MGDNQQRRNVPVLFVKGTHYEVGLQVGREFRGRIQEYLSAHPYRETILSYYKEQDGKQFLDSLLSTCRAKYPHYIEEIRGLATGAEIPVQELELLHLEKEVMIAKGEPGRQQPSEQTLHEVELGCTDLLFNDGKQMIIGHNMDFYNKLADTVYVVVAHILPYKSRAGREFPEEKFVSMQYTGFLFGGNCSYNQHGLVYALGATYPRDTGPARVPELFLRRHFLSATSPSDAMRILENNGGGCATGFAIHFAFLHSKQDVLWSAEVGPCTDEKKSEMSVLTVSPDVGRCFYAHTNHYQHLNISHYISASSTARKLKADELPVPEDMDGIRAILGNLDNEAYPIYKSPTVSVQRKQTVSCVYTGIFDIKKRRFNLYLDNPAAGGPILTLSLDMFN